MSSAATTPNLALPQWVAAEKPERTDFSAAFLAIDGSGAFDWNLIAETFTYASATTITVATGAASRWKKGDKFKLTQHSAVKYFYIVAVVDTTLTVIGSTGAIVIENTGTYPITLIYLSRTTNPLGFPDFTCTPAVAAGAGNPTTITSTAQFSIDGTKLTLTGLVVITNVGSASGLIRLTAPVTSISNAGAAVQEGAATGYAGAGSISASTALLVMALYNYATLWVNGYSVYYSVTYFI